MCSWFRKKIVRDIRPLKLDFPFLKAILDLCSGESPLQRMIEWR
jgi:hypothetical protein